jgi:hypothetical protein
MQFLIAAMAHEQGAFKTIPAKYGDQEVAARARKTREINELRVGRR